MGLPCLRAWARVAILAKSFKVKKKSSYISNKGVPPDHHLSFSITRPPHPQSGLTELLTAHPSTQKHTVKDNMSVIFADLRYSYEPPTSRDPTSGIGHGANTLRSIHTLYCMMSQGRPQPTLCHSRHAANFTLPNAPARLLGSHCRPADD